MSLSAVCLGPPLHVTGCGDRAFTERIKMKCGHGWAVICKTGVLQEGEIKTQTGAGDWHVRTRDDHLQNRGEDSGIQACRTRRKQILVQAPVPWCLVKAALAEGVSSNMCGGSGPLLGTGVWSEQGPQREMCLSSGCLVPVRAALHCTH